MIVCAIETSGLVGSVAICSFEGPARERRVLAEESYGESEGLRHGRAVIPSIERALAAARLGKGDVDLFVAGTGPGSYTGLRVGIATAKSLAFALGKAAVGAPSFDALAAGLDASALEGAGTLVVASDARRDRLYVAHYDPATRLRRGDFSVRPAARVLEGASGPVVLAGAALERYPDLLASARFVTAHASARALASLGVAAREAAPRGTVHDVKPLYLTAGVAAAEEGAGAST